MRLCVCVCARVLQGLMCRAPVYAPPHKPCTCTCVLCCVFLCRVGYCAYYSFINITVFCLRGPSAAGYSTETQPASVCVPQSLNATGLHFVRCIKPNGELVPDKFESSMTLHQLRWGAKGGVALTGGVPDPQPRARICPHHKPWPWTLKGLLPEPLRCLYPRPGKTITSTVPPPGVVVC